MRRLLFSFIALSSPENRSQASHAIQSHLSAESRRSNATHVVWKHDAKSSAVVRDDVTTGDHDGVSLTSEYHVQNILDAKSECLAFLRDNLMDFDLPFRETLGFPSDDEASADGLGNGLVGPTIELALQAKLDYPWTDGLPKEIFMEYVLNFGNLNEARTNWRPLVVDALRFNESDLWLSGQANLSSVVTWVNQNLWTKLGRPGSPIVFRSSQTPLIFDPMSIVAFGYASCTGTSILFANALRAVGVPARVVGTPAWYGNRTQGNHNWVEVYDAQARDWKFLEPSPANAGLDTLDNDPCMRWFCDSSRYPSSRVYAARLKKHSGAEAATYFPLAWEWGNQDVPAEERTSYYTEICGSCGNFEDVM